MDVYKPKFINLPETKFNKWEAVGTIGMIYGPAGCGKTTEVEKLVEKGLKVFVIDCDRGGQVGKKIAAISIFTYENLMDVVFSIKKSSYDIIVVDSIDKLADSIIRTRFVDVTGKEHPSDLPWGKGWDVEKGIFKRFFAKLIEKKTHILCIGHSSFVEKEVNKKTKTFVDPNLRGGLFDIIKNDCQYLIYMKMLGKARIPIVETSETVLAKDRTCLFPKDLPDVSFGKKGEYAITDAFLKGFEKI